MFDEAAAICRGFSVNPRKIEFYEDSLKIYRIANFMVRVLITCMHFVGIIVLLLCKIDIQHIQFSLQNEYEICYASFDGILMQD